MQQKPKRTTAEQRIEHSIKKFGDSRRLNMYEKLMQRAADCYTRACSTVDVDLRLFWYNAARGFEMRAREIKLSEVEK